MSKNVIIIGNSSSVLQKKNGDLIDSFDYVVRMGGSKGEGGCKIKGYEKHIGTRTDLFRVVWENHFRLVVNSDGDEHFVFFDTEFSDFTDLLITNYNNADQYTETISCITKSYYDKLVFGLAPRWKPWKRSPRATKSMQPRIAYDALMEHFLQHHKHVKKVIFYEKFKRLKVIRDLCGGRKDILPSNGLYTIDYIINTYPDSNIFITGFDGFKNRYYWKKEETFFNWHNSLFEQLYIKRLLKSGRVNLL